MRSPFALHPWFQSAKQIGEEVPQVSVALGRAMAIVDIRRFLTAGTTPTQETTAPRAALVLGFVVDNALRESASRIEQQWENLEILRLNAERLRSNDEL
jgi:hypothetical protein